MSKPEKICPKCGKEARTKTDTEIACDNCDFHWVKGYDGREHEFCPTCGDCMLCGFGCYCEVDL